jgi:hypothetical protein
MLRPAPASLALLLSPVVLWTPSNVPRRTALPIAQADSDDVEFLDQFEEVLKRTASSGQSQERLRIQRRSREDSTRGQRRQRPDGDWRFFTRESLQLTNLPNSLRNAYDDFLERPGQSLVLGSLSLLFGFYLAGALSTIFGAAGFWEPTIAIGPLAVGELITRRHYSLEPSDRSETIKLLNALKVGFYFGITLDALKLAG